jgi:hypothetical protein
MVAITLGFDDLFTEPLIFYGAVVPTALVLGIKRPDFFAMIPVVLCVMVN